LSAANDIGCFGRCLSENTEHTWHEAKAICQKEGWRLCRKEELDTRAAGRCCMEDSSIDECGLNAQLVWTSNLGGLQASDVQGRLQSQVAFENVQKMIVDLNQVQIIRGLQIQRGLEEPVLFGPSCVVEMIYYPVGFLTVAIALWHSTRKSPLNGVRVSFFGGIFFCQLIYILRTLTFAMDPSVPSLLSKNPICYVEAYYQRNFLRGQYENVFSIGMIALMFLTQLARPQYFWRGSLVLFFLMTFTRDTFLPPPRIEYGVAWAATTVALPLILKLLQWRSRASAQEVTAADNQKYDDAWELAGGRNSANSQDINAIRDTCNQSSSRITEARRRITNSTRLSWWKRLLFRFRCRSLDQYARTWKRRQRTTNIDLLFEEVYAVLVVS
jgi:hypothetical protein